MELNLNDLLIRLLSVGNGGEKGLTKTVKEEEIVQLCGKRTLLCLFFPF